MIGSLRKLVLLILVVLTAIQPLQVRAASSDDQEIRIGQEIARRLESEYKLVTDRAVLDRVKRVGTEIAAVSDRPELPYAFKVVDLDVPNAVSLPGGFIYVTRGLLSFVRSDHELAAVLAHEIAHAAHRHQMEMIRRSNEAFFWTMVVALLTRNPVLAQGAQLISIGLLSGYTRELERDADLTSIAYLIRTEFTPVAALTVMERLRREEQFQPQPDPGAFRDHPRTEERVAYIEADLKRRGIPLNRRAAANYLRITTRTASEKGRQAGEILVNDMVVIRLPDLASMTAVVARLDRFFNTDPDPSRVTVLRTKDGWEIDGGSILLLEITPAYAAFLGLSVEDAAAQIQEKLQRVIRQDQRMRQFNG